MIVLDEVEHRLEAVVNQILRPFVLTQNKKDSASSKVDRHEDKGVRRTIVGGRQIRQRH